MREALREAGGGSTAGVTRVPAPHETTNGGEAGELRPLLEARGAAALPQPLPPPRAAPPHTHRWHAFVTTSLCSLRKLDVRATMRKVSSANPASDSRGGWVGGWVGGGGGGWGAAAQRRFAASGAKAAALACPPSPCGAALAVQVKQGAAAAALRT